MTGFWVLTDPNHHNKFVGIRCPNCGRVVGWHSRRDGTISLYQHKTQSGGSWCMPGMPDLSGRIKHQLQSLQGRYTPLTPFRPPGCSCKQFRRGAIHDGDTCACGHSIGIHPGMAGCQAETPPLASFDRSERTHSMATVNICDRCGGFSKQDTICGVGINSGRDRNNQEIQYKAYEICGLCRAEFDEWIVSAPPRAGASVKDKYQGEVEVDPKQAAMMKLAAKEYAEAQANLAAQAKRQIEP